jgi:dihydrodiol dehydrogenase / D-xylose 1-dehydrogenase (NADP)
MAKKMGWGIISTGTIARDFAAGLAYVSGAELVAVGSRTREAAEAFGRRFRVPHRHASYEALVEDPDVDIVYVGTPCNLHAANSLIGLRAGKHVVCEKPFTINAREASEVIAEARSRGLFLMEAMWMRFLPAIVRLREILKEGRIGEITMLSADFSLPMEGERTGRLLDPLLGGGALLDLGVYPLSFASMILGTPERMVTLGNLGPTCVDVNDGIVLGYPGGKIAALMTSLRTASADEATVSGTQGWIRVHSPIYRPTSLTIHRGRGARTMSPSLRGNGLNYEAAEVQRCIAEGKLESSIMPLDESLAIMKTMDSIRAVWGLRYPME